MVATTMPSTRELIHRLKADYPQISFVLGDDFKWSRQNASITYTDTDDCLYLLHELAHALLDHQEYQNDVELLAKEREAWDHVRSVLSGQYDTPFNEDLADQSLETYRMWLHDRSLCPKCGQTGLQTKTSTYQCLNCRCSWRPNDARRCALRRYTLST